MASAGETHAFEVQLFPGEIDPEALRVELYADGRNGDPAERREMARLRPAAGPVKGYVHGASVPAVRPATDYTARVVPDSRGPPCRWKRPRFSGSGDAAPPPSARRADRRAACRQGLRARGVGPAASGMQTTDLGEAMSRRRGLAGSRHVAPVTGESPMKIDIRPFRVRQGAGIKLEKWPTRVKPFYKSKSEYHDVLTAHVRRMSELQDLLYAFDRYAVLLIFQAMDAAGKDGAIKHVMSGINPQGCEVYSFKQPSAQELQHDFLWRTTRCLPERGRIGIFNRSYYEEVLIVRVHPEILHARRIPDDLLDRQSIWKQRFSSILDLEKHLHRNGTRIIKFFLHLSKEEQRKRFLKRIDDPAKNWKFSGADMKERRLWKAYMQAYEECLSATSTRHAPWYVVPADDKKNARLVVSQVIVDTLTELKMRYPRPSPEQRKAFPSIRRQLTR
jgi:PPK2 family polyphosphate:nucleotide phosphotransferase